MVYNKYGEVYNQEEAIMKTINVVMSSAVALVGLFYLTTGQAGCDDAADTCVLHLNVIDCQNNSCCNWILGDGCSPI